MLLTDFASHVPSGAIAYCTGLQDKYQFIVKVVKPRKSRLGDFRVLPSQQMQITVNANLNPYAFLITYIHEVAHADVYQQHRRQARNHPAQPHGRAWQMAFQRLINPLLQETIFPATVLHPLQQYMARPAATTYACPALMYALRPFDRDSVDDSASKRVLLHNVPVGKSFRLGQKVFVRGTLQRTRIVCKETTSGKLYAVLAHAWVEFYED